jgi:hypothetical protein
MNIQNNPVTNTGKQAISLTVYFLVLFAAWEASTYLYARFSPDVKYASKRAYSAGAAKVKSTKQSVSKLWRKK